MKRIALLVAWLALAFPAFAQLPTPSSIHGLQPAAPLTGTEELAVEQGVCKTCTKKTTTSAVKTFIFTDLIASFPSGPSTTTYLDSTGHSSIPPGAGFAAIPTNTILANTSGSSSAPTATVEGALLSTFDVTAYGAKCDGSTDDAASINAATAAARAVYNGSAPQNGMGFTVKIVFPSQSLCAVHSGVNLTGFESSTHINHLIVDGQGAVIYATTSFGNAVVDTLGTGNATFRHINVFSTTGGNTYGWQAGRMGSTSGDPGGGAQNTYDNIYVYGTYSKAAVYAFNGEVTNWFELQATNINTAVNTFGLILDGANHWNVQSSFVTVTAPVDTYQSSNANEFYNAWINTHSSAGAAIWMENATNYKFHNGFFFNNTSSNAVGTCVYLYSTIYSGAYGNNRGLTIDGVCQGTGGLAQVFFVTGPGTGGPNFTATPVIRSLSYTTNYYQATNLFVLDGSANITNVNLQNLSLDLYNGVATNVFDTNTNYTASGRGYFWTTGIWNPSTATSNQVTTNVNGTVTGQFGGLISSGGANLTGAAVIINGTPSAATSTSINTGSGNTGTTTIGTPTSTLTINAPLGATDGANITGGSVFINDTASGSTNTAINAGASSTGNLTVGASTNNFIVAAGNWQADGSGNLTVNSLVPATPITLANVAPIAANSFLCNPTGSTAAVQACSVPPLIPTTATFTIASGCSNSAHHGGENTAAHVSTGDFTSGVSGTCTPVFTFTAAQTGYRCGGTDLTSGVKFTQTAESTTSCTMTASTTSGDKIIFDATGY